MEYHIITRTIIFTTGRKQFLSRIQFHIFQFKKHKKIINQIH